MGNDSSWFLVGADLGWRMVNISVVIMLQATRPNVPFGTDGQVSGKRLEGQGVRQ